MIKAPIDIPGILETLPHRFPFVMVDRILAIEPTKWIECVKQITGNEPFFQGHFPGEPLFPGVLQIEAAAQASALLVHLSEPEEDDLLVFGQVKRFTFIKPVRPGDQLDIRINTKVRQPHQGLAEAILTVRGEIVAKGSLAYGKLPR
jgi:beta-hydroxyacyl-ACP dehydratase FabZ